MPITRSAKKALRTSHKKRVFNQVRKDAVSKAIKTVKRLVRDNKKKEALEALRTAQKTLDKAAKEHTLKKNTASRKTSRLSKMIKKMA
jgi:small subunit ribosomal protein S20